MNSLMAWVEWYNATHVALTVCIARLEFDLIGLRVHVSCAQFSSACVSTCFEKTVGSVPIRLMALNKLAGNGLADGIATSAVRMSFRPELSGIVITNGTYAQPQFAFFLAWHIQLLAVHGMETLRFLQQDFMILLEQRIMKFLWGMQCLLQKMVLVFSF